MIFFLFHIEIEGKCRWIIIGGGGVAKGRLASSQIIGRPDPPPVPPLPTPMLGEANTEETDVSPEPVTQQLCCSDAT